MSITAWRALLVSVLLAGGFSSGFAHAQSAAAVQTLLDRAEIEELVVRYITSLDTRDADTYANVFTEDAIYETPIAVYEGRAAIRKIVTDLQESRARSEAAGNTPVDLYHVMSNSSIELISGTEARHTSYAQTVRAAEGGQFVVGFMGRYEDVIVKRDGRWQILSRKLVSFVQ
jgi:3-phenylpropionate/cinnamic acid dioxygenase small subunit